MNRKELIDLINKIDPSRLDYQEWLTVGMAMKHEGLTAHDWDVWSSFDKDRYYPGECFKKWETFEGSSNPVTGGSIYELARRYGVINNSKEDDRGYALDWNDEISDELIVIDKNWVENIEIKEPDNWNQVSDMLNYLELLFDPDEYVSYTFKSYLDDDGRYKPTGSINHMKARDIKDELIRYQTKNEGNEAIKYALGDYDEKAGAWICFNPVDGKGRSDKNIVDFRYALIESDNMEIGEQVSILHQLELPIQAIVHSGNKSAHAIVKVDASDKEEYKRRVNYIYDVCEKNGMILDKQNRNPSRLSRIPGVLRNGKKQFLIEGVSGKENFKEWQQWIEEINDDLGEPELPPSDNKPPILAPELIKGILREGHKMCIAGPSKAGKSFLLLELAIAFTQGGKWLGRNIKKSRVLYVNLELDSRSVWKRIWDILQKDNKTFNDLGDSLEMWNLRGKAAPMDKLAPKLIRRSEKKNYDVVIIDPIYKVLTGDENNARDMALFTNQFDKIATELDCAVIYCHHHSKGYQGQKRSMDRASGSGVFARDPDALLDLSPIEVPEENQEDFGIDNESTTAWRIEGTLREFPSFKPIDIYFRYPIHELDDEGKLTNLLLESDKPTWMKGTEKAAKKRKRKSEQDFDSFEMHFANYTSLNNVESVPLKEMAKYFDVTERTIRERVKKYTGYFIEEKQIFYQGRSENT